jgi:hypothetical protein
MSFWSVNLNRVNAIFLLLVTPIVVRFWVEAVVWRLERGRQMLGFSLIHGGAGWLMYAGFRSSNRAIESS